MSAKRLLVMACFLLSGHVLLAQKEIAKYFPAAAVPSGGAQNVQDLVTGFVTPIAEDFGSLSSSGWYHTGETHKRFGFDLTISMNAISASSGSKYFSVPTLSGVKFDQTTPTGGSKAPTAYGPENEFPQFTFTSGPNATPYPNNTFLGPDGGNVSKDVPVGNVAVPTIQAGIGLFANTDLRVRFTPEMTVFGTKLSSLGFGLMHDIKQHIPGIKMVPIGLSLFVAWSQLKAVTDLHGLYASTSSGAFDAGTGQEGVGNTQGYTAQVLISKQLPVITFYGGIGYNNTTTNYAINGTYYVNDAIIAGGLRVPLNPLVSGGTVVLTNPYKKDFQVGSFRATGGIRLKLGPMLLNGDYTYVNSKGQFSAGFGFTVR